MARNSGTRSGLLWEIERILKECDEKPQILLMENVPDIVGVKNKDHFYEWINCLSAMGYESRWQIMNGTDFEIPQNRKRCFMISWRGDHYYEFPRPLGNKKKLRDLLEPKVDEKYYLKNDTLEYFIRHSAESEEKGNGFRFEPNAGGGT